MRFAALTPGTPRPASPSSSPPPSRSPAAAPSAACAGARGWSEPLPPHAASETAQASATAVNSAALARVTLLPQRYGVRQLVVPRRSSQHVLAERGGDRGELRD